MVVIITLQSDYYMIAKIFFLRLEPGPDPSGRTIMAHIGIFESCHISIYKYLPHADMNYMYWTVDCDEEQLIFLMLKGARILNEC